MTFAGYLNQELVLSRTDATSRDAIGGVVVDTEITLTVDAYVWPIRGEEERVNRNTEVVEWYALIPAGIDVTSWDRAAWGGHAYDITSVEPVRNPREDTEHHIRLRLEEVR